jgi:hypothetical protein
MVSSFKSITVFSFASMQFAGYILSFYMLLLAVVPCCRFDECPEEKIAIETGTNHEEGDEDCGSCSPFFNCEGCASVSVTPEPILFMLWRPVVQQVFTGFICPVVTEIQYEFWQPPKLQFA